MKDSILLIKSKSFALRIVRLYKYLRARKESVIAKQMLRSGTSIGANIAESRYAHRRFQSRVVFYPAPVWRTSDEEETTNWMPCGSFILHRL